MKILSLVPSITETLIACNANLIGRTRFCIHPQSQVKKLPKLGGTKDINWDKVHQYQPDLVVLDKEENTLAMAESCPYDYIALHITSIYDVGPELDRLAERIGNDRLKEIAALWIKVTEKKPQPKPLNQLPGVIEWWNESSEIEQFIYLIWKDPWMAIGNNTFIQSVLDFIGITDLRVKFADKYPAIELSAFTSDKTALLFSSEPYPFAKEKSSLIQMGFPCALVDGEKYSWYGLRSLEFLQSIEKTKAPN